MKEAACAQSCDRLTSLGGAVFTKTEVQSKLVSWSYDFGKLNPKSLLLYRNYFPSRNFNLGEGLVVAIFTITSSFE